VEVIPRTISRNHWSESSLLYDAGERDGRIRSAGSKFLPYLSLDPK